MVVVGLINNFGGIIMIELENLNFIPTQKSFSKTELNKLPLTMAYVPMQENTTEYELDKALMAGTLFPQLDKPFYGKKCY